MKTTREQRIDFRTAIREGKDFEAYIAECVSHDADLAEEILEMFSGPNYSYTKVLDKIRRLRELVDEIEREARGLHDDGFDSSATIRQRDADELRSILDSPKDFEP